MSDPTVVLRARIGSVRIRRFERSEEPSFMVENRALARADVIILNLCIYVSQGAIVSIVERIDSVMAEVVEEVDGALGCAVADLRSGALLGVAHTVSYFTQEYLEAVAAAAVEMFRGSTVRHVEDLISAKRGRPSERLIEEMQMTTRHTIHFMMVLPNHREAVVVLITTHETSLGMGWAATRRSVMEIEPILDDLGLGA